MSTAAVSDRLSSLPTDVASDPHTATVNFRNGLSVLAGENLGTKTSQLLANEIHQILEERAHYQFYDTKTPLTDALVKKYISKDFTASGDTYDTEALRWANFLPLAPLEALRGREKDVQRLLQCGLLSEDGARELSKPTQEK